MLPILQLCFPVPNFAPGSFLAVYNMFPQSILKCTQVDGSKVKLKVQRELREFVKNLNHGSLKI